MKEIRWKLICFIFCVPLYPLVMLGEWYSWYTRSSAKKFPLWKETKHYWNDVKETLTYKKGE